MNLPRNQPLDCFEGGGGGGRGGGGTCHIKFFFGLKNLAVQNAAGIEFIKMEWLFFLLTILKTEWLLLFSLFFFMFT